MSTGKRLAKRSILGTRVACCLEDGKYYPGIICDVRSKDEGSPSVYSVRVEGDRRSRDLREGDLVGSGFTPVNCVKLRAEQKVFITFNNREVSGRVIYHRPNIDEVLISVTNPETNHECHDVKKRLEEIRLLESRKSPRLADSDTDFAKLADCASDRVAAATRRAAAAIDVPASAFSGSRKRRSSRAEDDLTDECAAALVLMKLSCSPRSPGMHDGFFSECCLSAASSASSGVWSLPSRGGPRSLTPSPPLSGEGSPPRDDAIDMDEEFGEDMWPRKRRSSTRVMFKCTWKECSEMTSTVEAIVQHIRAQHLDLGVLSPPSPASDDMDELDVVNEEDFYWTEVEVNVATSVEPPPSPHSPAMPPTPPLQLPQRPPMPIPVPQFTPSLCPTPSATQPAMLQFVAHHAPVLTRPSPLPQHPHQLQPQHPQQLQPQQPQPIAFVSSPPTLSHMDMARPPHEDPDYRRHFSNSVLSSSWPRTTSYLTSHRGRGRGGSGGVLKSGSGRGKRSGESRKCRKVYGMEQKEQWCTQCKWKKACSRFGE